MRYIGNKTRLLDNIEQLLDEKHLTKGVFADLFTGTGSVADHFKDRFTIIANDIEYYSTVFAQAKLFNSNVPKFQKFMKKYHESPFDYFDKIDTDKLSDKGFITQNYSPVGKRMFFQEDNAKKIDFIRNKIEELHQEGILSSNEHIFLLASLIESVMRVSNTSGTYEAFFKKWESRAKNKMILEPLSLEKKPVCASLKNKVFNKDANNLAREISGDIVYLDPPYTITQYASAYHLLETIALNDKPALVGKTGRREERKWSDYSRKQKALFEFADLFRQLNFDHIIMSYSNQAVVPIEEIVDLIKQFAIEGSIDIKKINYREYKNLNESSKRNGKHLQEYLIYFQKDRSVIKSPLNYAGSKDLIIDKIIKNLPRHISTFVDGMAGAYNVGINIKGVKQVVFNEKMPLISSLMQKLLTNDADYSEKIVQEIINKYQLKPKDKKAYLAFRSSFNQSNHQTGDARKRLYELYVLSLYSFQHMIRFNRAGEFNATAGNSGYNEEIKERLQRFNTNVSCIFESQSVQDLQYQKFDKDTLFYFDPPYIITSAVYNDGNRMNVAWTKNDELALLKYMDKLDRAGYKFLLSNVIEHKGKTNKELVNWIKENDYKVVDVGRAGRRFPRHEVLIKNY